MPRSLRAIGKSGPTLQGVRLSMAMEAMHAPRQRGNGYSGGGVPGSRGVRATFMNIDMMVYSP